MSPSFDLLSSKEIFGQGFLCMNYADDLRILVSVQERNHRKFYRVCENFVNNTRRVRVTDCTKNTIYTVSHLLIRCGARNERAIFLGCYVCRSARPTAQFRCFDFLSRVSLRQGAKANRVDGVATIPC